MSRSPQASAALSRTLGSTLWLNLALFAIFTTGVGLVASARTYNPWWPSSLSFYLLAATAATLLVAVTTAVLYGRFRSRLVVLVATAAESVVFLGVWYAVGDDTFVRCPAPDTGRHELVEVHTDLDLTSGRILCHWSDATGTSIVTTHFPILLTLLGRL